MTRYRVLAHGKTYEKAHAYLRDLLTDSSSAGSYLQQGMEGMVIDELSVDEFIELIVRTKKPTIFAESSVNGNGLDWNQTELSILGDISIAVPVMVYDNGLHVRPKVHECPFAATLLYTPGALLRSGGNSTPADWDELVANDQIIYDAYYSLYERRLLPPILHANSVAAFRNKSAIITVPGLGCGQFAGIFHGTLGPLMKQVLVDLLDRHRRRFTHIKAIYFDPYRECTNERFDFDGVSLLVRPLTQGNEDRPQLCEPREYEEEDDNFSDCELFSIVAWDHVSWPGNDFYIGSRTTDDGVKAAATSSMAVITGIEGYYNVATNTYDPPAKYRNWSDVVSTDKLQIDVQNNLTVMSNS